MSRDERQALRHLLHCVLEPLIAAKDPTAIPQNADLVIRQFEALGYAKSVLYGILMMHRQNELIEEDYECMMANLKKCHEIQAKIGKSSRENLPFPKFKKIRQEVQR